MAQAPKYTLDQLHGLYAGQFEPEDYDFWIRNGLLEFRYIGVAGFLGLATLWRIDDRPS